MAFRLYDLDYELDDKAAVNFERKAILFNRSDLNKLVIAGAEKLNHFISKITLHTAPPYVLHEHFLLLTVRFLFYPT